MIRVCSGWNIRGREQYGWDFLRTFDQHWPKSVQLQVWVEEPQDMPRRAYRSLWDIPGAVDFHDRHRAHPDVQGLAVKPCWKEGERRTGYSFRTDAYKFWKQILIPGATARGMADGDILIWLDGDVVTTTDVSERRIEDLVGNHQVAFLGREPQHSEIGFWAVRLDPQTRQFLDDMADWYKSDRFMELPEWHSAFIWDAARRPLHLRERNLCPPRARGHVFPLSPVGKFLNHLKGPRKGAIR